MNIKITVITVVFNDVKNIEETIKSVLNQEYPLLEYIIIDGGSIDGTVDIIKKYQSELSYWCSEKDDGIYDAMNKGIKKTTGSWINFMNSGDYFTNEYVLRDVFLNNSYDGVDVIYGSCRMLNENGDIFEYKPLSNIAFTTKKPVYRHGASFVATDVHKLNMFDLKLKNKFGFALDYKHIYDMYLSKLNFMEVGVNILTYRRSGVSSDRPGMAYWYIYRITHAKIINADLFVVLAKMFAVELLKNKCFNFLFKNTYNFFSKVLGNSIVANMPFWNVRKIYFKILGLKIGKGSVIDLGSYILHYPNLLIGNNTHINRKCFLDARAGISIGSNVSISHNVCIVTGGHDINSKSFSGIYRPITIGDNVWLGINSTVLQGVSIGEGAVVCAGSVVTKDIEPYTVVGGVPAKYISRRSNVLDYSCRRSVFFE